MFPHVLLPLIITNRGHLEKSRKLITATALLLLELMLILIGCDDQNDDWLEIATLDADNVMVFNGILKENSWGNDLVYQVIGGTEEVWPMESPWLGRIPLVDIWLEEGGLDK